MAEPGERPPYHVCRTCNMMLSALTFDGGRTIEWRHGSALFDDHPVDPMPLAEPAGPPSGVCDFCSDPHPAWVYQTRVDAPDRMTSKIGPHGFVDDGLWAACEECHRLIEASAWPLLVDRAARGTGQLRGVRPRLIKPAIVELHGYFRSALDRDAPARKIN